HGWGMSVDVRMLRNDGVKEWLLIHAVRFGFCWEYPSEPRRLTYYAGDDVIPVWTARCIELATAGIWLQKPSASFRPMNVSVRTHSYRSGDAILLAENDNDIGVSKTDVGGFAAPPSAVITSEELE